MTEPTEQDLLVYMVELAHAEQAGAEPIPIHIGPYTAITMIGVLQMACRHPEISDAVRQYVQDVIAQIAPAFKGTLGETLIRRGNDPAHDR